MSRMLWIRFHVNTGNIACYGSKSIKIVLPKHSPYPRYAVWVSDKLYKHGNKSGIDVSIPSTFTFKASLEQRINKREWRTLDEKMIDASELFGIFSNSDIDMNEQLDILNSPNTVIEDLKDDI